MDNPKGKSDSCTRRRFFRDSAMTVAGLALGTKLAARAERRLAPETTGVQDKPPASKPPKPPEITTNVDEARKIPRTPTSMPGRYPARVVKVETPGACVDGKPDPAKVRERLERGLAELTGERDMGKAWAQFVSPGDIVGIKANPIGEKLLSTKPEVVDVIIAGLRAAGVPDANIVIWDRRLFQLAEAGFTEARFPGIRILGTEMRGPNGLFFDAEDRLWSRDNIDRDALPYIASVEMAYDRETLPYMINEGRESYFAKTATRVCTKIVNVPVLKNASSTVTACLKNLSFGSLSNTARLHQIWMKAVAEPCAFPCLRDKVVLNIVDGLQACWDGGPGANPQFIWDANVMFLGTDPVAVDSVCHDWIVAERIRRGKQKADDPKMSEFLRIAEGLGLGTSDRGNIRVAAI